MHRRLVMQRLAAAIQSKRSFLPPFIIGLGIWIGFPTPAAFQDMRSLVSGAEASNASNARWGAFVEKSVAGSVHAAEMPFADANLPVGSISGGGVAIPGVGDVSFRTKNGAVGETPDEDRISRGDKKGRIVNVAPVAPPKAFNAGSVLDRTSFLLRPTAGKGPAMTFVKPDIKGKEIKIATAFYVRQDSKRSPGVPALLAALVNNDKADILATAYAPPEPDYAKASPFASLLQDEDEGRFIPPVAEGDHHWMSQPLPASVFSKAEQKCLAAGIYFESRGESLKGQAAVAQVILNRVRNPAYPSTICGVVYQNDHMKNRCQFSFACDGRKDKITNRSVYRMAEEVAMAVTAGKIFIPEVGSSTHYYADYVNPRWARTMEKMKKIGLHIFYRTYGGGWN
ncbi:cell wall hydrolase [Mesorhizobium sp. AaZ16]|uniref:cell wall hydrolase n=1 Tax=Mesorhizobium sp. AaZ16 TaxID=3402289 RepID=UPI00374FC4B8